MRAHLRSRLRAVVPLVVAGTLAIAATAASGAQPAPTTPLSDAAFRPVSVPVNPQLSDAAAVRPVSSGASESRLVASDTLQEPAIAASPPPRALPSIGVPRPLVVTIPPPAPPAPRTTHTLVGFASYYCYAGSSPCTSGYPDGGGFDAYAAAGPKLRAALGSGWRGKVVLVDGVRVKLIDWCQCYKGQSNEKLLDLYHDVFARTGSPVTIRW